MRLNQVTLPVRDYAASVAFYQALGLLLIVDAPPRYARFECPPAAPDDDPPTVSLHLDPAWTGADWPLVYLEVADVDAVLARLATAGVTPLSAPETARYGWREADVRDPAGNRLRLYQAGTMRRFPPWRVNSAADA